MDVRYLVLLFLFVACMPQAQVSRGNQSNTSTTGGTTSGSGTIPSSETNWNYLGVVSKSITINVSNLNNSYIVGAGTEKYLGLKDTSGNYTNFTNVDYCFVGRFLIGGIEKELRSRIVPVSYYDFSAKRTVKILRVDFNDTANSSSICAGLNLNYLNSSGTAVSESPLPLSYTKPSDLCSTCTSNLSAKTIRVFQKVNSQLQEVTKNSIDLSSLSLAINPNNDSTTNTGTCSATECQARGYNCCVDNQCVKDGTTRPSALTQYYSQWQVAEQERLQNPLAYLNYPQIYFICASSIPATTSGSGSGSSTGSYDARFEALKKDYACIQELKTQSTSTPFQNDLLNSSLTFTCHDGSSAMDYKEVMKRLYTTCGCAKTTLNDMITYCPAYEYTVTARDNLGAPTVIDCYTPPVNSGAIPSQQTVSVNSRSAPHRFFDSTGVEKVLSSSSSTTTQEGDVFEYLDDQKVIPSQQTFSMNAVLGQMSVTLDKALPAKTVAVELDQVYTISTTSGYYTPCPTCGKDSWTNALSAYPSTNYGVGLQALGHTTERDALSTNMTGGNYEDTIFGRACWIPPTMIPFSHSSRSTVQGQRLNRLKTQATLFINGYQRDWFGFNKGSMIGSFDGVTWFAIGKGRIVKSTSKKLFLAINAPFADLANPNIHVVNIQAYDGITQAAQVDYDPQYDLSHSYQNEAGNCQANHMCNTDTDCITRLGWEYMCADVLNMKSQLPTFDSNGNEVASTSTVVSIDQILHQKKYPSSNSKRCVYRGTGSPCLVDPSAVTDSNKRKTLTCAPNFYCAQVGLSGVFNSKVARYGAHLEDIPLARNHLFGKDANVLGRPLSYVSSADTTSLVSDVRSTLSENLSNYETLASSNTGLCQPGKALPDSSNSATMWNPYKQHMTSDTSKRTDYISQIGSCPSTLFTSNRYASCPVIGTDGNYEMFDGSVFPTNYAQHARSQNACGLDTLLNNINLSQSADTLSTYSPFKLIEAKTLNNTTIVEKSLARDACLRRAGQVCQTDLDCSPNKLHADQVDYFGVSYFGNEAEKKYHQEYLVCGQADAKPLPSDSVAFKNYDMTKNRCCREVGQDLSTYTSDIATKISSTATVTYDANSYGLKMSVAPGIAPNDSKRYSRLATVENLGTSDRPILSAYQTRLASGNLDVSSQNVNLLTPKQWMTLGEANSEACCGGGWIRKFSDGGHDWTRRDRLYLDVSNFKCLNTRTSLLTNPKELDAEYGGATGAASALINQDYNEYCVDPARSKGGCVEWSMSGNGETPPTSLSFGQITVNTVAPEYLLSTNLDFYFLPKSADSNSEVIMDYTVTTGRKNLNIKIPSYASKTAFDAKVGTANFISLVPSDGTASLVCSYNAGLTNFNDPTYNPGGACGGGCCYKYDSSARVLRVLIDGSPTKKYGVSFTINMPGASLSLSRTSPGTSNYYLKRLGRLELSGIPQIPYEELYCNDNSNTLVKGIFDATKLTKTDFQNKNFSFKNGGLEYYTSNLGLMNEPVFSQNDFQCCTPLGKTTSSMSKCCTGYGVSQNSSNTSYQCMLPPGANISVYFNRFVSNEGRGADQPGGGLVDADFDSQTGEPLLETSTQAKINSLGIAYCESGKIRQGGAFGSFTPEPQGSNTVISNKVFNIVDSANDVGQISSGGQSVEAGYNAFMDGFHWNHQWYCDD